MLSLQRIVVIALAALFLFCSIAAADGDYDEDHDYDYDKDKDHDKDKDYDHDKDKDHRKICAPKCKDKKWDWTYNSLYQSPCEIAAYLLARCHHGSYTINPLAPGDSYGYARECDECECNSVVYSLISACEACQDGKYPYFADYIKKCPKVPKPGCYPYRVPKKTRVPKWAFIDVTAKGYWDAAQASAVGGVPEAGPDTDLA